MRFTKKIFAILVPVLVVGLLIGGFALIAAPNDPPSASWRLAGDWAPLPVQVTATANTTVNVRSTPTSRPNGWNAGVSNANVVGRLTNGQVVNIVDDQIVRAWVNSDTSRRSDIGYTGPSRWVNIRTTDGTLEGWVYIAFLNF